MYASPRTSHHGESSTSHHGESSTSHHGESSTSHHGESSTSHKRMKTKPVALCAHCGYKASFEACFVANSGCLEKHKFSTALLENSRNHHNMVWFSIHSYKASPSSLFVDWLLSSHCRVEQFQSCNICSHIGTKGLLETGRLGLGHPTFSISF